jgi:exodeoxyribonuclease VII large subunit
VFPSLVHGEKASQEVLKQLLKVQNLMEDWENYNAVAIMRWGWWSEWMNWTNDRVLCESVCNFPVPIISAVWHTVDQSILDMIARYDCKTPSEAAQILIDIYEEYKEDIESEYEYILWTIEDTIKRYTIELEWLSKDIPYHISKKVQIYKKELEGFIVDKKVKYHIQILTRSLENTYKIIEYNNPKKILRKWYSLVLDQEWKVVDNIKIGESYTLISDASMYSIKVTGKSKIN